MRGVGVHVAAAVGAKLLMATCEAIGPCTIDCVSVTCSSMTGLPSGPLHRLALVVLLLDLRVDGFSQRRRVDTA